MKAPRRTLTAGALLLAGCNLLAGIDEPKHAPVCGDGVIDTGEACDDGDAESGNGCSASCEIEPGFSCTGQPSACVSTCSDGVVAADEGCDDGNTVNGDGCAADCAIEPGFSCTGMPSQCQPLCGDGAVDAGEQCDDGNTVAGDGCAADCTIEPGFACAGMLSACVPVCGDSMIVLSEQCDDGNAVNGDGCSALCQIEHGYACAGMPSACATSCGDGVVAANEVCDDGNIFGEDGCDATCHIEHGYSCAGEPSKCVTICGDGQIAPGEQCDDGNTQSGDGCSAACQLELGFGCTGEPSACQVLCGDGVINAGEQCDDGNTAAGDCCSPACQIEPGCLFEVEPNDTSTLADARAADPEPVKLTGSGKIVGSVSSANPVNPLGDVDVFAFSLAATSSVVRVETFDGSGKDCAGIDTQLGIVTASPLNYADEDGGIGLCSALVLNLAAGGYYMRVNQQGNSATIPAYLLELKVQNNAGYEVEPNDTFATATTFNGADSYMGGNHPTTTDADYYAITVPPGGGSLRAEIIEGVSSSCATMLTELALFNAGMQQVLAVSGGGRGGCSRIDGTGSAALHPEAHALAAGKHYLRVRSASTATPAQATFDYRLSLVLR